MQKKKKQNYNQIVSAAQIVPSTKDVMVSLMSVGWLVCQQEYTKTALTTDFHVT